MHDAFEASNRLFVADLRDPKKPDVTVEFNFHAKTPEGGEKYFNKTAPREFNTTTVRFNYQSMVTPSSVYDYEMMTRERLEQEMRELIDHGPFLPEDAVRAGLVDDVAYEDELDDKVQLGAGEVKFLEQRDYRSVPARARGRAPGPPGGAA